MHARSATHIPRVAGQVQFATDEQVAVLFADGSARTFLSKFVKRVER